MTRAQLTRRRGRLAAVVAATVVVAACSSDDDATSATADPTPATTETSATASPTTSDESGTDSSTLAAPADTGADGQDPTEPADDAKAPPTSTAPEPSDPAEAVDEMRDQLPGARAFGLQNWNVLVHTALQQAIPADEIDPFEGLIDCPPRARLPGVDAPWIERRFRAEPPVERVTTIRVALIDQDAGEHERWVRRLQRCEPITDEVWIDHLDRAVRVNGVEHHVDIIDVVTPATGVVPFPAQAAYATTHTGDRTLAVAVFGLDDPLGFVDRAVEHLETTLEQLD